MMRRRRARLDRLACSHEVGGLCVLGSARTGAARVRAAGDLTAVIGANDAGKSRLVRTFADSLASATDPDGGHAAFFASHSDDEVRALLWALDWNAAFDFSYTRADVTRSALAAARALHREADLPGWTDVVNELEKSRTFAFVPVDLTDGRAWQVYWCLPWKDESGMVATAVRPDALSPSDPSPGRTGWLLDQGWPMLRADAAGPVPIVKIGVAPIWWLPVPVFVPATEEAILATATEATTGLLDYLDWPEQEGRWLRAEVDTGAANEVLFDIFRGALRLGAISSRRRSLGSATEGKHASSARPLKGSRTSHVFRP